MPAETLNFMDGVFGEAAGKQCNSGRGEQITPRYLTQPFAVVSVQSLSSYRSPLRTVLTDSNGLVPLDQGSPTSGPRTATGPRPVRNWAA